MTISFAHTLMDDSKEMRTQNGKIKHHSVAQANGILHMYSGKSS